MSNRNIQYVEGESISVQGKREEIFRLYSHKYHICELGNGGGNWLLTKKSDILVDGRSFRNFVLEHYGKKRLTEKLADRFKTDVASGLLSI